MGYYTYIVKKTNKNRYMVTAKAGLLEKAADARSFDTYEEAYKLAKAYGWGEEPIDGTNEER